MVKWIFCVVVSSVGLFLAPAALAQVVTIKTPPAQASDSIVIPLDVHIGEVTHPYFLGWAGGLLKVHLLDAAELDVVSVGSVLPGFSVVTAPAGTLTASGVASPFGPPSSNVASVPASFNFYLQPTATTSGISVATSSSFALGDLFLHVKNSSIGQNSDIDLSLMLWNIYHVRTNTVNFPLFTV